MVAADPLRATPAHRAVRAPEKEPFYNLMVEPPGVYGLVSSAVGSV